eukprot:TRINITY_DN1635_c0_g1_i1.p3 TRINITY_DN1635_c0_g1~~TRINITY_DN1635_c0_g1_i1.p3  ORF type:complete len:50 (+),score=26.51 TRINITY_DN1635_c0_g1_i1:554-703(+)
MKMGIIKFFHCILAVYFHYNIYHNKILSFKKKKYRLRGRSSETAKAHRG